MRAMLSAVNFEALDELGLSSIVGSRATKAAADLESHFLGTVTFSPTGSSSTRSHPRHRNAKAKANNLALRAEPVRDPHTHPGAWWAIWAYSANRSRRDQKPLAAQEARARAVVDGENKANSA